MSSERFSYAGKLAEELFLLISGIGLSVFMVYELFYSNDVLTINGVYLGPLFSRMAMVTLLVLALALTIVTLANLNNRKHKSLLRKCLSSRFMIAHMERCQANIIISAKHAA